MDRRRDENSFATAGKQFFNRDEAHENSASRTRIGSHEDSGADVFSHLAYATNENYASVALSAHNKTIVQNAKAAVLLTTDAKGKQLEQK